MPPPRQRGSAPVAFVDDVFERLDAMLMNDSDFKLHAAQLRMWLNDPEANALGIRPSGRSALLTLDKILPPTETFDGHHIEETHDSFIVTMSAPGVDAADLSVSVE